MGKHEPRPLPVITAGESILHTWCPVCQEPWRIRIPLAADAQPCGSIEVCPGCGTGHAQPGVYVEPPTKTPESWNEGSESQRTLEPRTPLLPRVAGALYARRCARRGRKSPGCAWGDCPWPGLWRHAVGFDEDDGVTTYLFCRKSHRARWAAEDGVMGQRSDELGIYAGKRYCRTCQLAKSASRREWMTYPEELDYGIILAEYGMVCHICTREISSRAELHFDHVIPRARGGTHTYDNVRPSHKPCNLRKGTKLMSELGGIAN